MKNPESSSINNEFTPLTPEISPELQETYERKRSDVRYPLVCGDDRKQTTESKEALQEAGVEQGDAQIRYFGGAAGIERVLSVTLIASGKADKIVELGETAAEAISRVKRDVEMSNNVTLELHSAAASEGNDASFNPHSENGLGCAYAAGEAVVTRICAEDEAHHELTFKEQSELFGSAQLVEEIREANRHYASLRFSGGENGLSRTDFQTIGAPVQILKGQHAPIDETFVAINFTPDLVSNPAKAHAMGAPFYNNDVTQVAEMLIRTYPEFELDPEVLLGVMDQDIRATRAALAHGAPEGASALEVRRLGSPEAAIDYLKNL